MKVKKLIINWEEQNVVSSVNGQTWDISIPQPWVCRLKIDTVDNGKGVVSINYGELIDGTIVYGSNNTSTGLDTLSYDGEDISVYASLDGSYTDFTGIYKIDDGDKELFLFNNWNS